MELAAADKKFKEKLIRNVKKEVKQIMEEAVTRKFVHEESSTITSLCGAVEACLSQGLRRRALGLFKTSSTTALLHKIAKTFEPAGIISKKVQEIENADPNRRSSSSGDSTSRSPNTTVMSSSSSMSVSKPPLQKKNSSSSVFISSNPPKYLWIRLALFEKCLVPIIDHLVQNSSKYYEKDSLVADRDYGSILSSLLVGPCALDYSKTKTQDHFWTDPPADELVQRHRISSSAPTPPTCRRNVLNYRRSLHAVSSEEGHRQTPLSAKDYVESLHQNSKAILLYGKNNVMVIPKDLTEPMPGYLSLHQTASSLTIKWTPNQLMNGYSEADGQDKRRGSLPVLKADCEVRPPPFRRASTKTQLFMYWDYAMNVRVDEIVYVHCHQQGSSGGTIVLVGQDGVQRPPIHFPQGGHLLAFLSCLENGLLPHGQLDPPLWSHRGKGKVFPKLKRKGRPIISPTVDENAEDESTDYVFQIISKSRHEDFLNGEDLIEPKSWSTPSNLQTESNNSSSSGSTKCPQNSFQSIDNESALLSSLKINTGDSLKLLCTTMKRQIISRAFYGWLAYCRHLRTVRTHLSGLVNSNIVESNGADGGVTVELWNNLVSTGAVKDSSLIYRCTYFGGVQHELRKEVWPYLLGHYVFGSSQLERDEVDKNTRDSYETTMSEWLAVEAIVRQRDKEAMAANLAKLSSESTSGDAPPPTPATLHQNLSNDVFVSLDDDDDDDDDDNEPLLTDDDIPVDQGTNFNFEENIGTENPKCPPNSLEKTFDFDNNSGTDLTVIHGALESVIESLEPTTQQNARIIGCESPDEGMGDDDEGGIELAETGQTDECRNYKHKNEQPVITPGCLESAQPTMAVIVTTNQSVDSGNHSEQTNDDLGNVCHLNACLEDSEQGRDTLTVAEETASQGSRSTCISPASSQGGVYTAELLENFGLNLHRIDKDVQRCDRNYWYFTTENLEKLRNVMCTYVWEHLDIGYMQGMCDLVAPLLVIFDDEAVTYSCFCLLMERMGANFPNNGGAMDTHFANMRSLIQILDSEMFELMHQNGDYTHFYFCYRWFLLDFKRELLYEDVFSVWETIWAAKHVASAHFMLFIALALVEDYRDIILTNSMDFTDIIKFFNEMAERHDAKGILTLARELVLQLQTIIENK